MFANVHWGLIVNAISIKSIRRQCYNLRSSSEKGVAALLRWNRAACCGHHNGHQSPSLQVFLLRKTNKHNKENSKGLHRLLIWWFINELLFTFYTTSMAKTHLQASYYEQRLVFSDRERSTDQSSLSLMCSVGDRNLNADVNAREIT